MNLDGTSVSGPSVKDQKSSRIDETFPRPHSILTNSSLWQSEIWNRATTKISAEETAWGSLRLALLLLLRRRKCEAVYTLGIRPAQAYGFLCRILGKGNKPHIAGEIFLDEPRPESSKWKIKRGVRRFALARVDRFILFSSAETRLYSRELMLPPERFHFVPFHTNIQEPTQPELTANGEYGFAAGRSLRDWKTFFSAIDGFNHEFVVVADAQSMDGLPLPKNVRLYRDIPRSQYLDLLKAARFVIVPLYASGRSAGQVVVLEAEALGKPVIASDVDGVRDYVSPDESGLLVTVGDVEALRSAIQRLINDDRLCRRLATTGFERVMEQHTFPIFVRNCLEIIRDAIAEPLA